MRTVHRETPIPPAVRHESTQAEAGASEHETHEKDETRETQKTRKGQSKIAHDGVHGPVYGQREYNFRPGVSGNPGGRPKDFFHIRKMIRERGPEIINSLIETALDRGDKDHVKAAVTLLHYGYGKPTEHVEIKTSDPQAGKEAEGVRLTLMSTLRDMAGRLSSSSAPKVDEVTGVPVAPSTTPQA